MEAKRLPTRAKLRIQHESTEASDLDEEVGNACGENGCNWPECSH